MTRGRLPVAGRRHANVGGIEAEVHVHEALGQFGMPSSRGYKNQGCSDQLPSLVTGGVGVAPQSCQQLRLGHELGGEHLRLAHLDAGVKDEDVHEPDSAGVGVLRPGHDVSHSLL